MEQENWKAIEGYEGCYEVSDMGNVKTLARITELKRVRGKNGWRKENEKLLKQSLNKKGYPVVGLTKNNIHNTIAVHILVARHFIPNPENKPEVNHLKGIKTDNRASQLEWATSKEQKDHAINVLGLNNFGKGEKCPCAILNNEKVLQIRKIREEENKSYKEISLMFDVSYCAIYDIITKRSWSHI